MSQDPVRIVASGTVVRNKVAIGQCGFIVLAQDMERNTIGMHSAK